MGLVEHHFFRHDGVVLLQIVAETTGDRFEVGKRRCVRVLFGGVAATGGERNIDTAGHLNTSTPCEDDGVGHARTVRCGKGFEHPEHLAELSGFVALPVFLRCKADSSAVGSTTVIGTTERGCAGPGRFDQFSNGQSAALDGVLERSNIVGGASGWNGVLPNEILIGHVGAEVACLGAHVAVKEFEPGSLERIGEGFRVLMEVLRNLAVLGVANHGHIGSRHHGGDLDGSVLCIGGHVSLFLVGWCPLVSTRRALG